MANTSELYPGVTVTGLTGLSGTQTITAILSATQFTVAGSATSGGTTSSEAFISHTGITKTGGGLLDLADGNNNQLSSTNTGPFTINGGSVLINNDPDLGAVPAAFNAAAIVLNGGEIESTKGISFNVNRGITVGPQGGAMSYIGGATLTFTSKVTGPGSMTFSSNSEAGSTTFILDTVANGSNYQGATTLFTKSGSNLTWMLAEQIPNSSAVTVTGPSLSSAGTVNMAGFAETVGSLASAAGASGTGLGTITNLGAFTTGSNNLSTTYGGTISGATGSFTKVGSGTQTLSGNNSYGGNTTINAGTLLISGSPTGTGQFVVGLSNGADTGATLAGSGTIAGSVFVNPKGHLSPNNSAGGISTLTINNPLNISGGAILDYDFGAGNGGTSSFSASDLIKVTGGNGNLTIPNDSAPIVLNITPLAGFGAGLYDLIDASGSGGSINIANPTNFNINAANSNFFYYVLAPGQSQGTYTNPSGSNDLELLVVNNPNPQVTWTGNAGSGGSAIWDTTSANWTPGNYADGDRIVFDNNGTNRTISLGGSTFAPSSITFNNGTSAPYTLSNGTITGATTSLTKNSAGTVTLDTTLNATYGGVTQINSGTLWVNGSIGSGSAVTVGGTVAGGAAGTPTLAGSGTINGAVTVIGAATGSVAGHLAPSGYTGATSATQTLNLGGALTINSGASLDFNLSGPGSGSDQVSVTGSGAVNYGTGGVLNINAYDGGALSLGTYTLISDASSTAPTGGTGWTIGANNDFSSASRFYQIAVVGQNLDLSVSQSVTWGGQSGSGGNAIWDTGVTQNFYSGGVTSTTFATGNDVFFYDTQLGPGSGPAVQNSYINVAQGGVAPGFLSFNNNGVPYSIDTTGDTSNTGITGAFASVTLNGSGTVTLVGPNTYTGGTTLNAGTLVMGNNNSLGAASSSLTFNGGTLRYVPSSTNTDISGRTVTINAGGATIDLGGNAVTYASSIGNNGTGGLTLSNSSGAGAMLTFNAANTFGNSTSTDATELTIGGAAGIGGGLTVSISNGNQLGATPSAVQPASVVINGGTLRVNAGTLYGTSTINTNRGITLGAAGGTINIPLVGTGTFNTSEMAVMYSGVIAGTSGGNLNVTGGSGTNSGAAPYLLELGGQSTYNGNTTINNATVSFFNIANGNGPANILPQTTVLTLQNNGWFVFNNGNSTQQLAGLVDSDGTGVIGSTNGTAIAGLTIAPANGQTYTYNGVIQPVTLLGRTGSATNTAFTLTIAGTGTGTEILSNVNTYAGATTLNSGTLQITNNNQIGSTTGTIAALTFNGGTLRYGAGSTNTDVSGRVVTFGANGGTIDLNGNTVSYANGIGNSGAGGPTLIDSGAPASLTLSGASSYTGTTTVNSGTLIVAPTGTLGTGPLSIGSNGTVRLQNLAQSVSTLSGAGQLNLTGNGGVGTALTVSNGASTSFSGLIQGSPGASVALSAGALTITSTSNSYAGGTTVSGNMFISGVGTALGVGTVNVGSVGSLTVGLSQGLVGTYYNVAPVNTNNSNPNVASLLTLNTYFAGLTPTLSSNTTAAGSNFDFTTTGASFPGPFATVGGTTPQNFQSVYRGFIYVAAAGTYTFGANSDDGSVIYVNGGGSDPVTGVGTPTVNNNMYQGVNTTAGQPQVVGQYTFPAAGYYPIVTAFYQGTGNDGYQNFFAAGTTTAATTPIMSNSILFAAGATAQTIGGLTGSGAVNLFAGSNASLLVGSGDATSNFAGSFTGTATESITKIGAGTLTLSGSSLSTFVSPIQVNAGTLRVTSSSATGNAPITVGGSSANGSPTLAGGGTIAGPVVISGSGAGAAGHIAPSSFTGVTATALSLTGGLTLNTGSMLDFNLSGSPDSAGGPSLMNDIVNVTGGAVDYGTGGILNINAYDGSLATGTYTLISSSTTPLNGTGWTIGTNNDAGIATHHDTIAVVGNNLDLIVTSATLNWTGANPSWDTSNKASWVDANGSATMYSNGVPVVFGDTFPPSSTPVASTGGNVQVTVQSTGVTPGSVTFSNSALNYIVSDASPTDTVGIGGSTSISLQGTGTVTFTSANSFTGTVGVSAGQLNIQNSNALGNSSGVSVASGAALQLQGGIVVASIPLTIAGAGLSGNANGALQSVSGANSYGGAIMIGSGGATITSSSASGGDGLTLTGGINNNGNLLTFAGAGNTAVNSVGISGGGGLTLSGPGTLTLSASNGYTGPTNVNGGTLRLTGSLASGSAVTIGGASASGTPTLVGNGTINGSLEIFGLGGAAGHLAPSGFTGTSAATLHVGGSLTLDGGSVLDFNLSNSPDGVVAPNASNDHVAVGGNLSLLGQGTLNINATSGGLGVGTYQLVDYSGTLFGDATQWSIGSGGQPQYNYQFVTTTAGQFDLSVSLKSGSATWSGNSPGSDGVYGNSANWTPATVPNGAGQIATFGSGSKTTISLGGSSYTVGQLDFDNTGNSNPNAVYTISSGGSLVLDNSLNSLAGAAVNVAAGLTPNINTTLVLSDSTKSTMFNIGSGATLNVSGSINESATVTGQQISLTGGGTLELDGVNGYTGGTTVTNGTLTIGANNPAASVGSGPLAIGAAGIVNVNSSSLAVGGLSGAVGSQLNVADSTTLSVSQTGTGTFSGALALGGSSGLTVSSGTLRLNVASSTQAGGATATVASAATLQLTGSVSALSNSDGSNPANVVTHGTFPFNATDGALSVVGTTSQTVGTVTGDTATNSDGAAVYAGNTTVGDGTNAANLTATQILQNTLTINANSTVTIAPSAGAVMAVASAGPSAAAASSASSAESDSGNDPLAAIQAAIASGSISSSTGQRLENRIAAIERLAASDPGLDVSLLESRVLAALPSSSILPSTEVSPLADSGSSLLAADTSAFDSGSSGASATFAAGASFSGSPAAVPEPSTLLLAALGGVGLAFAARRRVCGRNC